MKKGQSKLVAVGVALFTAMLLSTAAIANSSSSHPLCPGAHFDGKDCVKCKHGLKWSDMQKKCICPVGNCN